MNPIIINNRTLRNALTVLLGLILTSAFENQSPIPNSLILVAVYFALMWLVSRPYFDFQYEIATSWLGLLVFLSGLLLVYTGYQVFNTPLSGNLIKIGLCISGIGVMLGISNYFDTNNWVRVESGMSIIGLLLVISSLLPPLMKFAEQLSTLGTVLFCIGVMVMTLTYTKKYP